MGVVIGKFGGSWEKAYFWKGNEGGKMHLSILKVARECGWMRRQIDEEKKKRN